MRIKTLNKSVTKKFVEDPIGQLLSRAGDIPVLITVPHGGGDKIPAVPYKRVKPPAITGDTAYNGSLVDTNTQLIAAYIMEALIGLGVTPYIIMTNVQRQTLDFNRSWSHNIQSHVANSLYKTRINSVYSLPYVAPRLKYRYDAFFEQIDVFQNQIKSRYPSKITKALHIDLHGTGLKDGGDFAIGNLYGRSAAKDITNAMNKPNSLKKQLITRFANRGLKPSSDEPDLQGAHILRQCGKSAGGFNSIQLELGQTCRATSSNIKRADTNRTCAETAQKIANSLHRWLRLNKVI